MKKIITSLLLIMTSLLFAGCSNSGGNESAGNEGANGDYSKLNIALISDTIGTEQFILQAYEALKEASETYGFKMTSIECTDTAAWEENTIAASNEGYDLIIGIGWQAADPFSDAADRFPDTKYAVIDTTASNEKVTSFGFDEAQGSYVLGAMVGTAFPNESLYGYVASFQTQATYKYRYGFAEGVKSVNPNAKFMYNYTNSYNDTNLAYEYTLQQKAAGANFIFGGVSASANSGIYQAAQELTKRGTPIYTTGLSVDQTTSENPSIISGLLKNTGAVMNTIINEFLAGKLNGGSQLLGLKEGAFGVVGVSPEEMNYRNTEIITDEVIAAGKAAAEKIISGELVIEVPEESAK